MAELNYVEGPASLPMTSEPPTPTPEQLEAYERDRSRARRGAHSTSRGIEDTPPALRVRGRARPDPAARRKPFKANFIGFEPCRFDRLLSERRRTPRRFRRQPYTQN
jgi:hypothetical protein